MNKELKSAIIQNCHSKHLRRFALREEGLTLHNLLSKARSLEASKTQATGMEKNLPNHEQVNHVSTGKKSTNSTKCRGCGLPWLHKNGPCPADRNKCRYCGLTWPHRNGPCPAIGQTCGKCGKMNHFATACRSPLTFDGYRNDGYRND